MMRDFCSGVTRAKMVVFGSSATRAASSSLPSSLSGDHRAGVEADLAADVCRDLTVVAGDDLDGDLEPCEPRERFLDVGFDGIGEAEESLQGEVVLVVFAEMVACERTARDRDYPSTRREEAVEDRLCLGGHGCAAGEDTFWGALGDQPPSCCASTRTEDSCRSWSNGRRSSGVGTLSPWSRLRCGPERAVELVTGLVATGQTEDADVFVWDARAVERLRERDLAFGQCAGLVGEQHLDVAEVLDRDQTLDDHAFLGEAAGTGRQADGDDGGQ